MCLDDDVEDDDDDDFGFVVAFDVTVGEDDDVFRCLSFVAVFVWWRSLQMWKELVERSGDAERNQATN